MSTAAANPESRTKLEIPTGTVQSLDEFISPLPRKEFLQHYFGRKPAYIRGTPQRFSYLLDWESLNDFLSGPQGTRCMRLSKDGRDIRQEMYTRNAKTSGREVPVLDLKRVSHELRDGATLVIYSIEQANKSISDLARTIELALGNYIDVVVFASWYQTRGLRTHWDPDDAFIVQVLGRKHWRIFENQHRHPIAQDKTINFSAEGERPYWEGDLNAGDILYIPSGWWHDAIALSGESVHVSFGSEFPRGIDLGQQLLVRLSENESLRAPVPHFSNPRAEQDYVAMFRQALANAATELSIDAVIASQDAVALARGRLSLPWTALPDTSTYPISDTDWAHWLPPRPIPLTRKGDTVILDALGSRFTFPANVASALIDLMRGRRMNIGTLTSLHPATDVRKLLVELACSGLVSLARISAI